MIDTTRQTQARLVVFPSYFAARLFLLVAVLAAYQCAPANASPINTKNELAIVEAVFGLPTIQPANSPNSYFASESTSLTADDVVRTGSAGKATILFLDGSEVLLDNNTEIVILRRTSVAKGENALCRLVKGQILAHLRPGTAITTLNATASVRGTDFQMNVDAQQVSRVAVIDGTVAFFNRSGSVLIQPNQESIARAGTAPTAPLTAASHGVVVEWTTDLSRAVVPREKFFFSQDDRAVNRQIEIAEQRAKAAPSDAQARGTLGESLFDARRFAAAADEFDAANRSDPQEARWVIEKGDSLLALGRLSDAEKAYQSVIDSSVLEPAESNDAGRLEVVNKTRSQAEIGLAWVSISRDMPELAQVRAQRAVTLTPTNSEANIALGIALFRRGETSTATIDSLREQSLATLEVAEHGDPSVYRYQAHAWKSMVLLAQNDAKAALQEATVAVTTEPNSSLSHANLSAIQFFAQNRREAEKEALIAVRLNPESVTAAVALGQSNFQKGNIDAAANAGARAVALDPRLGAAYYLLGVADTARRDYVHAERELRTGLKAAPDFAPIASALTRVLIQEGRTREATDVISVILTRRPRDPAANAAYGRLLYEEGRYKEALSYYDVALSLDRSSALTWAERSRVAIDANRLNEAIVDARIAVQLAPDISYYHAQLGLAYSFAQLDTFAEKEEREALALDPENALALAQLSTVNQSRASALSSDTTFQAHLIDPAVDRQQFQGGTRSVINPVIDDRHADKVNLTNLTVVDHGALDIYTYAFQNKTSGTIPNSDSNVWPSLFQQYSLALDPHDVLSAYVSHSSDSSGGGASDDRFSDHNSALEVGLRRTSGYRVHLWAGLYVAQTISSIRNPNFGDSQTIQIGTNTSSNSFYDTVNQTLVSERDFYVEPELRLDYDLGNDPTRPNRITVGAAIAETGTRVYSNIADQATLEPIGTDNEHEVDRAGIVYAQWSDFVSRRLSFTMQLRWQHIAESDFDTAVVADPAPTQTISGTGNLSVPTGSSYLPSFVVQYQTDRQSTLRLYANKQVNNPVTSTFVPDETLLTSEGATLPYGEADTRKVIDLEFERYLSASTDIKLFAFAGVDTNVTLDSTITNDGSPYAYNWINRKGLGIRLDHTFSSRVFLDTEFVPRHSTEGDPGSPYNDKSAPDQASYTGNLNLAYVEPTGNKVYLNLAAVSTQSVESITNDSNGNPIAYSRTISPAFQTVGLEYVYEPSVRNEIYIGTANLLNSHTDLQDRRRIYFGLIYRFR